MGAFAMPLMAFGSLLGGGAAVMGAMEAGSARRSAERQAGAQMQRQQQRDQQLSAEQGRLAREESESRKRLNQGVARSGRRRIRGGLFGESEQTPAPSTTTLG